MTATPVRVVGVQARSHYPWGLLDVAYDVPADGTDPVTAPSFWDSPATVVGDRVPVSLVREPDNPVDSHAIRVEVPALRHDTCPDDGCDCQHVGYIPADLAGEYAPLLDAGVMPTAWVREIPVGSPTDMRPGLVIFVEWPN